MNAFYWYLAGFGTATVIALLWFHGNLKPKLDEWKAMAAQKISGK